MRLALAHARAETANLARYPAYAVPTVVFPAILLLVLGRQFERGEPDRLLAGFAATAVLTVAFFQFGVGIATSRTTPWEAYLRLVAIPTPNWKNATVRSAVAAKPAKSLSGSPRSNWRPRTSRRMAGNTTVGTAYAG